MSSTHKAIFLDRDGVLNQPVVKAGLPYPPVSAQEFTLYPDAAKACKAFRNAGFLLVVVTNQPDVGRGTQTQAAVEEMHAKLLDEIDLDRIEVCYAPDSQAPDARRRKPAPGMVLDAADTLGIDLSKSFLIGDRWRDIDCGHAVGVRTVFIDRGYAEKLKQQPHFTCASLMEAAEWVFSCGDT
jgi:D-glycero-D-manno-heptose 1,7-bisphosphate phosphatase